MKVNLRPARETVWRLALYFFWACGATAWAQNVVKPVSSSTVEIESSPLVDRLRRADAATSLDETKILPWHLKMNVKLFDLKGIAKEEGTIEEWWAAPGHSRIVYDTPSYKATVQRRDGDTLRTRGSQDPPNVLETLLAQAVHPMPLSFTASGVTPSLQQHSFGKVLLDCIMLERPIADKTKAPLGLFPTYCMDPAQDSLRLSFNVGAEVILRNAMGRFQNKSVATSITYRLNDIEAGTAHISTSKLVPHHRWISLETT